MQIALPPEVSGLQQVSPQEPPAHGQLVQPGMARYDSHLPSTQSCEAPHVRPHSPQLVVLVRVLTQPPAQSRVPLGHMVPGAWQAPAMQT